MEEGRVDGSSGENRGGDPSNPRASAATVVIVDVLRPAAWRNFREFRGICALGRSRRHIRGTLSSSKTRKDAVPLLLKHDVPCFYVLRLLGDLDRLAYPYAAFRKPFPWLTTEMVSSMKRASLMNSRGSRLFTCKWTPMKLQIKGLIFICHGYGGECSISMADLERFSDPKRMK